jgi:polysaccharide biosynthesis transport protein
MNGNSYPTTSASDALVPMSAPAMPSRSHLRGLASESASFPWARSVAALYRYKWVILGIVMLGVAAGVAVSKTVKPLYETHATIWISTGSDNRGPIRARELFQSASWTDLLRSFVILDRVSTDVPLFVRGANVGSRELFSGAHPGEHLRPGQYALTISANDRYRLLNEAGELVEQGTVGDSIGRTIGLAWLPTKESLAGKQHIDFSLQTPRAASVALRNQVQVPGRLTEGSTLFRVGLSGDDPDLITASLNALTREFVTTSADLKKKNLQEMANTLRDQLDYAQRELAAAEIALEDFRVKTITLPADGGPVAAGVEMTRDPVFRSFFDTKISLDNVRQDREALEKIVADLRNSKATVGALWSVPSVMSQGQELRTALTDHSTMDAKLRALRQVYQDDHPAVREMLASLRTLQEQTIPTLAGDLVRQLRQREADLGRRIGSASTELRSIPARTIEEMRLHRNVQTRETLYLSLKNRFDEARLADASAMPDLTILDTAVAPQFPSRNTAPRILLIAVAGSLGAAFGLALLLDRIDRRFRYPEQATKELGLNILAAVPKLGRRRRRKASAELAAQVVESFRTLRLAVGSSVGARVPPIALTISSPGPGDGKTLVSSNLALAFAEAGYRTLLVDGDIRRGSMHSIFGGERSPGLVECLRQEVTMDAALQATSHHNLTLLSTGARMRRGPELLASRVLMDLFAELRRNYDVIIVDSPPLGVGIDPFALCLATQNMLLVLRAGTTDRVLAESKLEMLDRLPVRVIGAVLNDVPSKGAYRYYGYTEGYGVEDPTDEPQGLEVGALARR